MRKALNDNPMIQIAVLALGVVAFGLILMTSMSGGGSGSAGSEETDPTAAESAASDSGAAAPEVPGAPATPPASSGTVPAPSTVTPPDSATAPGATPPGPSVPAQPPAGGGAPDSADGMLPSKGLPQDLLVAFAKGDAIALLVSNPRSASFERMRSAVKALDGRPDVSTFIVESDEIAKYSRITAGVAVSRVPALIVIRPRNLTGNVPTASVSYGFRGKEGIAQAIDDAVYQGRRRSLYP